MNHRFSVLMSSALHTFSHLSLQSGFASITDCETPAWRALFAQLEPIQHEVLALEPRFRSPKHTWGSTPLYHWSRVWEYPMVFAALTALQTASERPLRVLDFGSSVTFFDVALARQGMNVIASDIDPLCTEEMNRFLPLIQTTPGTIEFTLLKDGEIPLDTASLDAVISVSVFEHIVEHGGKWRECLREIHRVLKPGGTLILTIDVGADDENTLTPTQYRMVREEIEHLFTCMSPRDIPVHDRLDTFSGPRPLFRNQVHFRAKQTTKFLKSLFGIDSMKLYRLTCEAIIAEKSNSTT